MKIQTTSVLFPLILFGILIIVLLTATRQPQPQQPIENLCIPGSNVYQYQTAEHKEGGIYTCSTNGTVWEFKEPCTENYDVDKILVDRNTTAKSITAKLTCKDNISGK